VGGKGEDMNKYALLVMTALLYMVGINGEFQFDDYAWLHGAILNGQEPHIAGRPLASLLWNGIWRVWGINPLPYKIISLILHLGVIDVLWRICDRFKRGKWGVVLFAVHPVFVSTVAYPVQASVMMAALFMAWAFLMYDKGKYARAVLFCTFATMSKQNAWMFPAVICVYEWVIVQKRSIALPLLIGSAAVLYAVLSQDINAINAKRGMSAWNRICTQAAIAPMYLKMVLLPHISRYTLDHGIGFCKTPVFLIMWTIAAGCGLYISNRAGRFAILGLACLLVPEFTIINLELVFEHRLYAPIAFLVLFAPEIKHKRAKEACTFAVMYLIIVNTQYQAVFSTQRGLWEHTLKQYPLTFRAHLNMAKLVCQEEPLLAQYHFGKLKDCLDRKGGMWQNEFEMTYSLFYEPTIDKKRKEFEEWIH